MTLGDALFNCVPFFLHPFKSAVVSGYPPILDFARDEKVLYT